MRRRIIYAEEKYNIPMLLSELKVGESGRVTSINNQSEIKIRLNNIGVTEGVVVTVVRVAPFSDPVEIKLRDFYLALRKSEAQKITVEKL